jgi:hypothetical protein
MMIVWRDAWNSLRFAPKSQKRRKRLVPFKITNLTLCRRLILISVSLKQCRFIPETIQPPLPNGTNPPPG